MMNYGNNTECIKALRVNVQLYYKDSLNDQPNTRFYFPETPELNGKTIVGIKLNAGTDPLIDPVGGLDNLFDLPDTITTENAQGIAQDVVGPRGVSSTYGINIDPYLYLTIYDDKHTQVLSNYPVHDLASYYYTSQINTEIMGRIKPFEFKINIRESFVLSSIVLNTITNGAPIASFTFYYK